MKDIDDMRIGESFYLKMTVAVISTRTGTPCEFDEERIDINELFIAKLEEIKTEILEAYPYFDSADVHWGFDICRDILDNHIKELKGENNE